MRLFAGLAGLLIVLGLVLAHHHGPLGGPAWITGVVLLAFAVLGLQAVRRERAREGGTVRPS
jgi:hypothetical protein